MLHASTFRWVREVRRAVRRRHGARFEALFDLSDALGSLFEGLHQRVVVLVDPTFVPLVERQDRLCVLLDRRFQVHPRRFRLDVST